MALYQRETTLGFLRSISIARSECQLGLQLFAEDSSAFCVVEEVYLDRLILLFATHCLASGLKINQGKSKALWMGKETPLAW
eukprot:c38646_g1_i1 orf=59-304(+)